MDLTSIFFTSFVMGFSGAMMPGPLLTVNIRQSYRRGFSAGPLLIVGHGLLELALVIGLTLGLGALLVQPFFKGGMALVGGLVLFWMGWRMVRDSWRNRISLQLSDQGAPQGMSPVLSGVIVSASNPYWILWWVTIGMTYVALAFQQGTLALVVFFAGHILADFLWYSGISFAVVSGKKLFSEQAYRLVIMICGIFLCGLALYFIGSGKTFLMGN